MDAVFLVRNMQEKHLEKNRNLFAAFLDLEKAYDRVPREIVYWCLRKRNVPEGIVWLVEAMYANVTMVVRTSQGDTDSLEIGVGLHQGSALSPLLFIIIMDTLTENCRSEGTW